MDKRIWYYEGYYKYQLAFDYEMATGIKIPKPVHHDYFVMDKSGYLAIRKGYAWDGASGPTLDTSDSMRASLVHDVLYQMIGHKLLPIEFRDDADYLFYDILREDGMVDFRAWAWLRAVRAFGHGPAVADEKPMKFAPMPPEYAKPVKFGMA